MSDKKINTWKDLNNNDAHDKDDEMRLFVGGGKNSGMMTVNPKEKQVEGIFQKAQETYGARSIDEVKQSASPFQGTGYGVGTAERKEVREEKRTVITFWKVNDGPQRLYSDPTNDEFMQSVEAGRLPRELGDDDKDVEIINNKSQEYVPPKRDITKLEGTGQALGGDAEVKADLALPQLVTVDPSLPQANIRVRFADGTTQTFKFNLSHTVGQVRSHLEAVRPCGKPFALKKAYPPSVLENFGATLEAEGLKSASLVQETQ